jgi:glycosyltransferase involved in cell wall biosynthesis
MNQVRWFAPNRFTSLLVPELRRRGLTVAVDGAEPARLAVAMSGTRAEEAWRYARSSRCPLILYIWDLPPVATGTGSFDPVWSIGGVLLRLPRPVGGYRRRRGYYSRLRYIAARATQVWVPSTLTADLVRARYKVEPIKVAYCYDSDRFFPDATPLDQPPTLLTVSRFKVHKNQAATIRAAAALSSRVQVRLIGQGPERESLKRLAVSLGIQCEIQDNASDDEVVHAYRRAAVVVCPSRFEGFGLAPLEGIASGTPVVASDIPPHREFVSGAAQFFPLDDEHALEAAIVSALDQPAANTELIRALTISAAGDRFLRGIAPFVQ